MNFLPKHIIYSKSLKNKLNNIEILFKSITSILKSVNNGDDAENTGTAGDEKVSSPAVPNGWSEVDGSISVPSSLVEPTTEQQSQTDLSPGVQGMPWVTAKTDDDQQASGEQDLIELIPQDNKLKNSSSTEAGNGEVKATAHDIPVLQIVNGELIINADKWLGSVPLNFGDVVILYQKFTAQDEYELTKEGGNYPYVKPVLQFIWKNYPDLASKWGDINSFIAHYESAKPSEIIEFIKSILGDSAVEGDPEVFSPNYDEYYEEEEPYISVFDSPDILEGDAPVSFENVIEIYKKWTSVLSPFDLYDNFDIQSVLGRKIIDYIWYADPYGSLSNTYTTKEEFIKFLQTVGPMGFKETIEKLIGPTINDPKILKQEYLSLTEFTPEVFAEMLQHKDIIFEIIKEYPAYIQKIASALFDVSPYIQTYYATKKIFAMFLTKNIENSLFPIIEDVIKEQKTLQGQGQQASANPQDSVNAPIINGVDPTKEQKTQKEAVQEAYDFVAQLWKHYDGSKFDFRHSDFANQFVNSNFRNNLYQYLYKVLNESHGENATYEEVEAAGGFTQTGGKLGDLEFVARYFETLWAYARDQFYAQMASKLTKAAGHASKLQLFIPLFDPNLERTQQVNNFGDIVGFKKDDQQDSASEVSFMDSPVNAELVTIIPGVSKGGVYKGSDGIIRFVKQAQSEEAGFGEHISSLVMRAFDRQMMPETGLNLSDDGRLYVGSRIRDAQPIAKFKGTPEMPELASKALMSGMYFDVLLANWDAVGQAQGNLLVEQIPTSSGRDYRIVRIDTGGSLFTRGTGYLKDESALRFSAADGTVDRSIQGFLGNPEYTAVMGQSKYLIRGEDGKYQVSPYLYFNMLKQSLILGEKVKSNSGENELSVDAWIKFLQSQNISELVDEGTLRKYATLLYDRHREFEIHLADKLNEYSPNRQLERQIDRLIAGTPIILQANEANKIVANIDVGKIDYAKDVAPIYDILEDIGSINPSLKLTDFDYGSATRAIGFWSSTYLQSMNVDARQGAAIAAKHIIHGQIDESDQKTLEAFDDRSAGSILYNNFMKLHAARQAAGPAIRSNLGISPEVDAWPLSRGVKVNRDNYKFLEEIIKHWEDSNITTIGINGFAYGASSWSLQGSVTPNSFAGNNGFILRANVPDRFIAADFLSVEGFLSDEHEFIVMNSGTPEGLIKTQKESIIIVLDGKMYTLTGDPDKDRIVIEQAKIALETFKKYNVY